jgi:hypothetical protein
VLVVSRSNRSIAAAPPPATLPIDVRAFLPMLFSGALFRAAGLLRVLLCSPQLNWDQCRLSASCEGRGLGGFSQAARRAAAAPWLDFSDIPWFPFVKSRDFCGFLS